jgi:pimeloyl-ACP methyl ester carboxylesterase
MINLRRYGKAPFSVAVIHGGPGARGEIKPVALEISKTHGVLEYLQTATSINGQITELKNILNKHAKLPITLIGYSWGAWLGFIFSARYPKFVRKLILVSSGPFEEKYATRIQETRLKRLNKKDREEVSAITEILNKPTTKDKNKALARFGTLLSKADSLDPVKEKSEVIECNAEIFHNVWKSAAKLRKSGALLEFGKQIKCPVIAISGDYDPHPAQGVQKPLSSTIKKFRFIMLKNCGHTPWIEKRARKNFFDALKQELAN